MAKGWKRKLKRGRGGPGVQYETMTAKDRVGVAHTNKFPYREPYRYTEYKFEPSEPKTAVKQMGETTRERMKQMAEDAGGYRKRSRKSSGK